MMQDAYKVNQPVRWHLGNLALHNAYIDEPVRAA